MTADPISPTISVIIVNYNSGARLQRCLDALYAQTRPATQIIVIDNDSSDGSSQAASASTHNVVLIEAGENLGFAVANNRAAKIATGDWLAFLNPDAYPRPDWLEVMTSAIIKHPCYDAFGSLQINAGNPDKLDGAGDVFHGCGVPYRGHFGWPVETAPPDGECFSPCAAAAIYRKTTFETLNGFEESFFCYCEDIDLGYRLRLSGGRALQLRDAAVLHEGSGVTGRHSDFSIYHGHRNRIWTYIRNTPATLLALTLPLHVLFDIALLMHYLLSGRGGAYLRAVKDAISGAPAQWAARKRIQKSRRVSSLEILSALTWSPLALLRRRADLRPVKSSGA